MGDFQEEQHNLLLISQHNLMSNLNLYRRNLYENNQIFRSSV